MSAAPDPETVAEEMPAVGSPSRIDRWLQRWPAHLTSRMPEPWGHPATDVLRLEEWVGADDTIVIRANRPPAGVEPNDRSAHYDDGILEIRVTAVGEDRTHTRIAVTAPG